MKGKVLTALIVAIILLAGCGGEEDNASTPILPEDLSGTITEEPTSEPPVESDSEGEDGSDGTLKTGGEMHPITSRIVVDGKMQSYLTGEWKDETVVKRRNMAVMIANNGAALPQYGISKASIIYEAPMENWSTTRVMALIEDYDELDRVGPIRSSRDYFVYEAMGYGSIYCNWGLAVPYAGPLFDDRRIDNISEAVSGQSHPTSSAFDRVPRQYASGKAYATEYTGYMFIDGYTKGVTQRGYDTEYSSSFKQAFSFVDDGYIAEYSSYPDATKVYPGGKTSHGGGYGDMLPCFSYNEEEGLYYRTQYNADQIDEWNGERLAVTNVVFKVCIGEKRDSNGYLVFGVHGDGNAYVFTNGKVIKGTWKKDGDYSANLFLDENGNEIVLNQGKTWICCIGADYEQYIAYE